MACEISRAYGVIKEFITSCDKNNISNKKETNFLVGERLLSVSIDYDIEHGSSVDLKHKNNSFNHRHQFGVDFSRSYKEKKPVFGAKISDNIETTEIRRFDDISRIEEIVRNKEDIIFSSKVIALLLKDDEVKEILYRRGVEGLRKMVSL